MLFDTNVTELAQIAIVPAEVRMGVAKATHQRSAFALYSPHFRIFGQAVDVGYFANTFDAFPYLP